MLGIRMRRAMEARKGVKGLGFRRVSGLEESADRYEGEKKSESKVEIEGANAGPGGVSDDNLASSLFDELSAVFKSVKGVGTDPKQLRKQLPARRPAKQVAIVTKAETLPQLRSRLKQLFEEHRYYECMLTFTKLQPKERRNLPADRACFLYAIAAAAKATYARTAIHFLEEMEAEGFETDETIYRAAIFSVESSKIAPIEGMALLERMKYRGITPSVEIYNSLLRTYGKSFRRYRGIELWDEMREAGIEPNQDSFVAVVTGLVRKWNLSDALDWSKKMEAEFGPLPPLVSFELLGSLAKVFQYPFLAEEWAKYQQGRSGDDPPLPIGVCVAMIRCGARFCAADFCLGVLKQLREDHPEHVPSEACYGAVNACGVTGRFEEAFDLLATMSEEGRAPRAVELHGLVQGLAKGVDEVDRGYYVLEGRLASDKKVYLPELNVILTACVELGDTERTAQTFEEVVGSFGLKPTVETYEILLRLADRSGQLSRLQSLIAEMQQRGLKPTRNALQTLAASLVRQGKESEAIAMLQNGVKSGLMPTYGVLWLLERRYSAKRRIARSRLAQGFHFNQKRLDDWGKGLAELTGSTPSMRMREPNVRTSTDDRIGNALNAAPSPNRLELRKQHMHQGAENLQNWGTPPRARIWDEWRNQQGLPDSDDLRNARKREHFRYARKRENEARRGNRNQQQGGGAPADGPTPVDMPTDGAVTGGAADLAGSPASDSFKNDLIEQGDLLEEMMSQVEAQRGADAAAGTGTADEGAAAAEEPGKGSGHEDEAAGSAESVQAQGAEAVDEATDSVAEGPSATAETKPKRAAKSKKRGAQLRDDGADLQQESATP